MLSSTHLHAMVIHFPIALLVVGFVAEVASFLSKAEWLRKASFSLLLLGALGAIAAYVSGSLAGAGIVSGPLQAPMALHEDAGLITMILATFTALYRLALVLTRSEGLWLSVIGMVLSAVLMISVARTGYLGGQLVYGHGAGVQLALPDFDHPVIVD